MTRFFTLLFAVALFAACGGPEGTEVESSAAEAETSTTEMVKAAQYVIDASASTINWEGGKLIGGGHNGTLGITDGQIMVAGDRLVGGKFAIDLRKLENLDIDDAEGKAKLEGHLKSADFFDVENYPMADFVITNVQPAAAGAEDGVTHNITGNLTMKGKSRSVTIPAVVSMDGKQLKASTPAFTIDRTEWGVEYGSGSLEGIAKDNIINDEIGLQIMLVANQ